jgi:hypothetical protein
VTWAFYPFGGPDGAMTIVLQIPIRKDNERACNRLIAKQLIEAQGGEITAGNFPEKGLQVRFVLPAVNDKS